MKQKESRYLSAFTVVEIFAIILTVLLLAALWLPKLAGRNYKGMYRLSCLDNLKEIGTAYRLWAEDNGNLMPAQQTVAKGGWADLLTNANQGAICWTNYVIISNELGQAAKLLGCVCDERKPAYDFTNVFDNSHVSYFVGVSANGNQPQSIQGGDRNLGPGTVPANDYGYSSKSGDGNDVAIPTNSLKGPVSWTLKIHSAGQAVGAGNILLGDGSAQQVSTASLNQDWLPNASPTSNWPAGHVPATPSIRLVFP
jgi:hypothetical protein